LTFVYRCEINSACIGVDSLNCIWILGGERLHDNRFSLQSPGYHRRDVGPDRRHHFPKQGRFGLRHRVLRECQDVVGYLPVELIDYISNGLNLSRSEVFGVVSFYALFSLQPKGRNLVKVCMGTACYVKGIKEVITRIENHFQVKQGNTSSDRRFSLEAVRCLGRAPGAGHGGEPRHLRRRESGKIVQILDHYE